MGPGKIAMGFVMLTLGFGLLLSSGIRLHAEGEDQTGTVSGTVQLTGDRPEPSTKPIESAEHRKACGAAGVPDPACHRRGDADPPVLRPAHRGAGCRAGSLDPRDRSVP